MKASLELRKSILFKKSCNVSLAHEACSSVKLEGDGGSGSFGQISSGVQVTECWGEIIEKKCDASVIDTAQP